MGLNLGVRDCFSVKTRKTENRLKFLQNLKACFYIILDDYLACFNVSRCNLKCSKNYDIRGWVRLLVISEGKQNNDFGLGV